MTQQEVFKLLAELTGSKNTVAVPMAFVKLLDGDVSAAYLLSQLIYWSSRSSDKDGWIRKTYAQWLDEIGLSQYQIKRAATTLKPFGVQACKRQYKGAPTMHYRVDQAVFVDTLRNSIMKKLDNQESLHSESEESSQSESEETSFSIDTKTTTKTTTEITKDSADTPLAISAGEKSSSGDDQSDTSTRPRNEAFDIVVREGYGIDPANRAGVASIGSKAGWFAAWCNGNAVKATARGKQMIPGSDPVMTGRELTDFIRWYKAKGLDFPSNVSAFVRYASEYRTLHAPPPPPKIHHIPPGWCEREAQNARTAQWYADHAAEIEALPEVVAAQARQAAQKEQSS